MRINCGGFELNENDFELDGETLSLKNSGGGSDSSGGGNSGAMVVSIYLDEVADVNESDNVGVACLFKMNKTFQEIRDAYKNDVFVNFRYVSTSTTATNSNEDKTYSPSPGLSVFVPQEYSGALLTQYGYTDVFNAIKIIMSPEYYESYKPSEEDGELQCYEHLSLLSISFSHFKYETYPYRIVFEVPDRSQSNDKIAVEEFICLGPNDYPMQEMFFAFRNNS